MSKLKASTVTSKALYLLSFRKSWSHVFISNFFQSSMLYDDEDLGGHEPGQQQNQQTDEDGGSSESDNNLYESSEPEREDWQDEIDTEKDWDMKIVGVEVANGDEI